MNRIVVTFALASVLVVGCGSNSTTSAPPGGDSAASGAISSGPTTTTTPEQVHVAWIEAIRGNNRDALLVLAADMEYKTAFVDDNLRSFQDRLRSEKDGKLQSVDIRVPTDDGAGKIGVSVWKFEKHTSCYRTVLATVGGIWRVTSWGVMYQCPADAT